MIFTGDENIATSNVPISNASTRKRVALDDVSNLNKPNNPSKSIGIKQTLLPRKSQPSQPLPQKSVALQQPPPTKSVAPQPPPPSTKSIALPPSQKPVARQPPPPKLIARPPPISKPVAPPPSPLPPVVLHQHDWDDLDAIEMQDPTMVSEYAPDIFKYLKELEVRK